MAGIRLRRGANHGEVEHFARICNEAWGEFAPYFVRSNALLIVQHVRREQRSTTLAVCRT